MNFFKRNKDVTKAPGATRFETLIGTNTSVKGDIKFDKAIRVDGSIEGNIAAKSISSKAVAGALTTITIGKEGVVTGCLDADTVHIAGTLNGNVNGTWVHLSASARVHGDVSYHQTIQVEAGARIEGKMIRLSSLSSMSPLSEDSDSFEGHILSAEEIADANLPQLKNSVYVTTPISAA